MRSQTSKTLAAACLAASFALTGCKDASQNPAEAPADHRIICNGGYPETVIEKSNAPPENTVPAAKDAPLITLPDGNHFSLLGLIDHHGRVLTSEDAGKLIDGKRPIIFYFGFPECDWFCPPAAQAIMGALGQFEKGAIQVVFIASGLDQKTGKPYSATQMKEWLDSFGGEAAGAVALTGSETDLARIWHIMKLHDARGTHMPYAGFAAPDGAFKGSAKPFTEHTGKDGKVDRLIPAPDALVRAIKEKLGLTPVKAAPPAPSGP